MANFTFALDFNFKFDFDSMKFLEIFSLLSYYYFEYYFWTNLNLILKPPP